MNELLLVNFERKCFQLTLMAEEDLRCLHKLSISIICYISPDKQVCFSLKIILKTARYFLMLYVTCHEVKLILNHCIFSTLVPHKCIIQYCFMITVLNCRYNKLCRMSVDVFFLKVFSNNYEDDEIDAQTKMLIFWKK